MAARRWVGALIGALLVVPPVAVAAPGHTASDGDVLRPRDLREIRAETVARSLKGLGLSDGAIDFLRDDQRIRTARYLLAEPAGDLDRDGTGDVFESDVRYRFAVGGNGAEDQIRSIVTARDGATGKKIWRRKFDTDVWPVQWQVGAKGRPGALLLGNASSILDPTGAMTISFEALTGARGRTLWNRSYTSTYSDTGLTWVAANQFMSFGRMDAIEGKADELMLGLSTVVGSFSASSAATRTIVVDGRDGTEFTHPIVDVGVTWVPVPGDVGDLDGDGFDDIVTTNNPGVDPGGNQEAPAVGPMVYARRGDSGAPIWAQTVPMEWFAYAWDTTDVAGTKRAEVGLETIRGNNWHVYLLDGEYGTPWWDRRADWMNVPGDIDDDGRNDVVVTRWYDGMGTGRMRFEQHALKGSGRQLWRHETVWDYDELPCPRDACSTYAGFGIEAGADVDADRVNDPTMNLEVGMGPAASDETARILDGRTGRLVYETEAELSSPGSAFDGDGHDLTRFSVAGNQMRLEGITGRGRVLWGGRLMGPRKVLPRRAGHYSLALRVAGDRCGDVLVNVFDDDDTFYAVIGGGSGRVLWSRWSGPKAEHPRFAVNRDRNRAC